MLGAIDLSWGWCTNGFGHWPTPSLENHIHFGTREASVPPTFSERTAPAILEGNPSKHFKGLPRKPLKV